MMMLLFDTQTHTHPPDMVGAFPGLMFSHAHTHASEYVYMGHVGPLFWTRWGTDLLRENDPLEGGPQEGAAVDFFFVMKWTFKKKKIVGQNYGLQVLEENAMF